MFAYCNKWLLQEHWTVYTCNMQVTKIEQVSSDGLNEYYSRPVVIGKVISASL